MHLYCEKILFNKKTNSYEIILDFSLIKDLEVVSDMFKLTYEDSNQTLLVLSNLKFESYKGFKSGYWYDLPEEFFRVFELVNEHIENSRVIAELEHRDSAFLDVQRYRTKENLYINTTEERIVEFKDSKFYSDLREVTDEIGNLELIVRNVGCGNWNEIKSEDFWLIYDLGGDVKFTDKEMQSILSRISFNQNFIGVISHWDLDHYRAILDMDSSQLSLMKNITVPSKMPNTIQLRKTISRLRSLKIPINILLPAFKRGRSIDLISQGKLGQFELFRSCDGSNINQSGILLVVEGVRKVAVLTGDHHYPQIYNSVFSTFRPKPYELVVPHHGGHAGKFKIADWSTINFSSGALSTKGNSYRNLPQNAIHNFFVMHTAFHCTDCAARDYVTCL
ncbi:aldolase [Bacillus altitudinis]|uniref:aldolase n=1 Tax=Bacillus altitudinis TaxID=293387 RepID=UPI003F7BA095